MVRKIVVDTWYYNVGKFADFLQQFWLRTVQKCGRRLIMIILLFETSSILKTRIATIAFFIIIYKIVNFLWVIYYFLCGIELGSNDYEIKKRYSFRHFETQLWKDLVIISDWRVEPFFKFWREIRIFTLAILMYAFLLHILCSMFKIS